MQVTPSLCFLPILGAGCRVRWPWSANHCTPADQCSLVSKSLHSRRSMLAPQSLNPNICGRASRSGWMGEAKRRSTQYSVLVTQYTQYSVLVTQDTNNIMRQVNLHRAAHREQTAKAYSSRTWHWQGDWPEVFELDGRLISDCTIRPSRLESRPRGAWTSHARQHPCTADCTALSARPSSPSPLASRRTAS